MIPSISFLTFGCKVNQYESDWMARQLANGYSSSTGEEKRPDLVIVNTCTVTAEADRKNLQAIHRSKRRYPDAKVLVMGCHTQLNPEVYVGLADGIVGNGEKLDIVHYAERVLAEPVFSEVNRSYWLRSPLRMCLEGRFGLSRAFALIQDGCTTGCTYCKIYHARGPRSRSKPLEEALSEIRAFSENAYREIVLLGINVGQYQDGSNTLVDLLERALPAFPNLRFRLSSINPEHLRPELLALWRYPNLCKHLHLSIQSGSASVLRRMGRLYGPSSVWEATETLRQIDPLFSFTADVIVGFPGESERDFVETCDLIQRIEPLKVHIFRFSPRKNTPAASFSGRVDEREKKMRSRALSLQVEMVSRQFREKHLHLAREIVVETVNPSAEMMKGHDEFYILHSVYGDYRSMPKIITGEKTWVNPESIDRDHIDGMVSRYVRVSQ